MVYRYTIDIEHAGGADLSFVLFADRPLVETDPVRDTGRNRRYVIVSVGAETSIDPLDPQLIHGSAIARPAS